MTTITIEEAKEKLPKSINDIPFGLYLEFTRIQQQMDQSDLASLENQLLFYRIIELFLGIEEGGIDDFTLTEVGELSDILLKILGENIEVSQSDHFTIGDITYATRKITDMNDLTTGEYVSIQLLKDKYKNDSVEFLAYLVAVLVRPATLVKDEETGEERWVQEKFGQKDINNLEYRVNLFKEKAYAKDLYPVCLFFSNMKK